MASATQTDLGQSHGMTKKATTHRQNSSSTVSSDCSAQLRSTLLEVNCLIVEVNMKYIKGMINNPNLCLNTAINCRLAGILLFDFELVHVPGTEHKGPDGMSSERQRQERRQDRKM